MKRNVSIFLAAIAAAIVMISLSVIAFAAGETVWPTVDVEAKVYASLEELGVSYDTITAEIPVNLEHTYDGDSITIDDIGADVVYIVAASADYYFESAGNGKLHASGISEEEYNGKISVYALKDNIYLRYVDFTLDCVTISPSSTLSARCNYNTFDIYSDRANHYFSWNDGDVNYSINASYNEEGILEDILSSVVTPAFEVYVYYDETGAFGSAQVKTDEGTATYRGGGVGWIGSVAPAGFESADEAYFTALSPSRLLAPAVDIYPIPPIELDDLTLEDEVYRSMVGTGMAQADVIARVPMTLPHSYRYGVLMLDAMGADHIDYVDYDSGFSLRQAKPSGGTFSIDMDAETYASDSAWIDLHIGNAYISYSNFEFYSVTIEGEANDRFFMNDYHVYKDHSYQVLRMSCDGGSIEVSSRFDEDGVMYENGTHLSTGENVIRSYYNGDREFMRGVVAEPSGANAKYYIDGGWYDSSFVTTVDPPEGFEDVDEEYFTEICPCYIPCSEHDFAPATCAEPKTCRGCGLTEGELAEHVWEYNDEGRSCSGCGEFVAKLAMVSVPEISGVESSFDGYGISHADIWDSAPKSLVVSYADGVYTVIDDGFESAIFTSFITYNSTNLTLADNVWRLEMSEEDHAAGGMIEITLEGGWYLIYRYNSLEYIHYDDSESGAALTVLDGYAYTTILGSENGQHLQVRTYYNSDGSLTSQEVSGTYKGEIHIIVYYTDPGLPVRISAYADDWIYLVYGYGWSYYEGEFDEVVGVPELIADLTYEDIAEIFPNHILCEEHSFTELTCTSDKFCTVCGFVETESSGHDFGASTCSTPGTCSRCGEPSPETDEHSWVYGGGGKSCGVCGESIIFPTIPIPGSMTHAPSSFSDIGIDPDQLVSAFPATISPYLDGNRVSLEDFGYDAVKFYSFHDYERYPLQYEDGFWYFDMPEDLPATGAFLVEIDSWTAEYYNDNTLYSISFSAYLDDSSWSVEVYNGMMSIAADIEAGGYHLYVYTYYSGDGSILSQTVIAFLGDGQLNIEYDANGEAFAISAYGNSGWVFYFEGYGWSYDSSGYTNPADYPTPEFEGLTLEDLTSIAPCIYECEEHSFSEPTCTIDGYCTVCLLLGEIADGHNWTDPTCEAPSACAVCGETDGDALGHDWADATCDEPITCLNCGETDGDALGHDWIDADCLSPMTCSVCGEYSGDVGDHDWLGATCTEGKTCSVCGEVSGRANGHSWVAATCEDKKTCEVCEKTTGEPLGHDWSDGVCTECGALKPADDSGADGGEKDGLSGGAIAAIVSGSTVAAGAGGFSIFWFAIKKKKWSDLLRVFKKS